jgi:hypothetical protein
MADTDRSDLPMVEQPASRCRHLRNKGMYVHSDESETDTDDAFDTTVYWCFETMKAFGPDDQLVGRHECRDSGRTCYEPL